MRLGEVLVDRGIITENQLKKALDAQLIFGAHLGTCLIELGYLDEEALGNLLSGILGVRYAHKGLLSDIPPNVIQTLTSSIVEKHRAIPFALSGRILNVALVDPKRLPSLDDLAFVSGCRIEAWVAPEVRIMQAIERYYDVPRRLRYITLAHRLDGKEAAIKEPVRNARAQYRAAVASIGSESSSEGAAVRLPPRPESAPGEEGLARAADELCRVEDAERLAKVILNQTAHGMSRSILFSIRGEEASIWDSRGFRLTSAMANRALFELTTEPVFSLLFGEPSYRGRIPDDTRFDSFFKLLGLERPAEALILPVHLHDRLVAMFYGDGGPTGAILGETEDYRRLMSKMALAIDLLTLKRKIRAA